MSASILSPQQLAKTPHRIGDGSLHDALGRSVGRSRKAQSVGAVPNFIGGEGGTRRGDAANEKSCGDDLDR